MHGLSRIYKLFAEKSSPADAGASEARGRVVVMTQCIASLQQLRSERLACDEHLTLTQCYGHCFFRAAYRAVHYSPGAAGRVS